MAAIGFWTDERVTALLGLHAEGLSCRDIGEKIGASRNAVIGRAYRMGLSPPPVKKAAPKKQRAKRSTESHDHIIHRIVRANGNSNQMRVLTVTERSQYKLRCVEIEPLNKSLLDLEKNECRYAYGDGAFVFCGHPAKEGSSYCVPHHSLCWEPPRILTDKIHVRAA